MPYFYHVRIEVNGSAALFTRLNLHRKELDVWFLAAYREGRALAVGEQVIDPADIQRIRISTTDGPRSLPDDESHRRWTMIEQMVRKGSDTSFAAFTEHTFGLDITADLITGPPRRADTGPEGDTREIVKVDPKVVFVVHGRDVLLRNGVFAFLRAIGLHPLEWSQAVALTETAAPYVGEVLEAAFRHAQAVVVVISPDDEAHLKPHLRRPRDPRHETELTGQARPNVLYEAGIAMSRHPERTVLVECGEVRPFSDIDGRHVVRLNGEADRRMDVADRLKDAGCPVVLSGRDWLNVGPLEPTPAPVDVA